MYIKREPLLKSKQWLALQDRDKAMAKAIIQGQPTADVVEVVRCKDCLHCGFDYIEQGFGYPSIPIRVCLLHYHETTLEDYCSYGEAKMDGKGEGE